MLPSCTPYTMSVYFLNFWNFSDQNGFGLHSCAWQRSPRPPRPLHTPSPARPARRRAAASEKQAQKQHRTSTICAGQALPDSLRIAREGLNLRCVGAVSALYSPGTACFQPLGDRVRLVSIDCISCRLAWDTLGYLWYPDDPQRIRD